MSVSKLYAALVINIQKEKKKSVLFGKCHISKKTCFVRFAIYCLLILKVLEFVGMCIIGNWKLSGASSIPFIALL